MGRFTGILGLLTMLAAAYAFSTNRRAIRLKTVVWGLGLQFVFAVFVLRIDAGRNAFQKGGDAVQKLLVIPMADRISFLAILPIRDRNSDILPSECFPRLSLLRRFSRCSITSASCRLSSGFLPG